MDDPRVILPPGYHPDRQRLFGDPAASVSIKRLAECYRSICQLRMLVPACA
jgi:hypothetical protein